MSRLFLRVLSEANLLPDDEGYDLTVEWLIKEDDGSVRGSGTTDYRGLRAISPTPTLIGLQIQITPWCICQVNLC